MHLSQDSFYLRGVEYANLTAQIGFFSSTVFCYILISLTVFGVKRNFGSYKNLLIIFPTIGILFATIEMIVYPHVHSYNAGYVFYSTNRPFSVSNEVVTWMLAIYTGLYAFTISLLAVQFVYRYWAVFDETKLRFFKGWYFSICLAYSAFFGISWTLGHIVFEKIDTYAESYMKMEMMEKYGINISNVAGTVLVAYDSQGNVRWWNSMCIINMVTTMTIQYAIISYCAYFMWQKMEGALQMMSTGTRNIHKQFFKTLILQITTPTITLFSPLLFMIFLPYFNLEISFPSGIFLCSFTLYPAMDAIIIMYVVTDYRKVMKKGLKKYVGMVHNWLNSGTEVGSSRETQSARVM